jgi:rubrerythrin
MKIHHPKLVKLLKTAYSAEKAASLAYIGHAKSVKNPEHKIAIQQIELDEWENRAEVLKIMEQYDIPISKWLEFKFYFIGQTIAASCFVIGKFMPYYFAGVLESGNVCEYFVMMKYFRSLGITEHDEILYEMAIKEKEHEVFYLQAVADNGSLPLFEKLFGWGKVKKKNDVDFENLKTVEQSDDYCNME